MAIKKLTLDEDATRRILEHRNDVRIRLNNYVDVLQDAASIVWTKELITDTDFTVGFVFKNVKDDITKYGVLDTYFDDLYTGYAASDWKTDLDTDVTALTTLKNWIVTAFNNNFTATDPEGVYLIMALTSAQKTSFANNILTALG